MNNFRLTPPKEYYISPDMKKRAKLFIIVSLLGDEYCVPITENMKRLFGIRIIKGKVKISWKDEKVLREFLQDVIGSVYFQVRDTVGQEVSENLSQEIQNGLEKIFKPRLDGMVKERIRLLGPK